MLEFDAATKQFGLLTALDTCSFAARPGRLTGFLGPNGAGKTTAMRAVFGLVDLDAGEVRWCGEPIAPQARAVSATCQRSGVSTPACAHETSSSTSDDSAVVPAPPRHGAWTCPGSSASALPIEPTTASTRLGTTATSSACSSSRR